MKRFTTADVYFSLNFSRKLTHLHLLLFDLCNIAWPSQQQLSSCRFRHRLNDRFAFVRSPAASSVGKRCY